MAVTEQDSKYYIGVGMTTDSGGSFVATWPGASASIDSKTKSKKAKLGMFLESGDRLELSYQSGNNTFADDNEYDIKGIDISYKLFFEETKVGSFTPYGVVGIGKHESDTDTVSKIKGNQWAAGVGGVYGVDKDLEVEISAKYTKVDYGKYGGIEYENSGKELYLGVNYKL
ncbi:hypothetical protein OAS51_05155 [Candidatus Thioglobus sp.]|nr:hypothetical protein [Candidatus Thioglobus sp.]